MKELLKEAEETYKENFDGKTWFGRCIFLSWYCDVGTCKFCYRSTQKSRIKRAEKARRSLPSIITEAILAKNLNWRIEFLTGGYKIFPKPELKKIIEIVSKVYNNKIWLNLGALSKEELNLFKNNIKGVVASIETINPKIHKTLCPDKATQDYESMLKNTSLKKSITIIIGVGETKEDFHLLENFIKKYNLDRITFYALKPITGTPFKKGPDSDYYVWWIAKTRIAFPKLEIIAGTTLRRIKENPKEIENLMKAGANAITKFPATKKFNSPEAKIIENSIKKLRTFTSTLTKLPKIDWNKEVEKLNLEKDLENQVKQTLEMYLKKMN